jgi:hypothetical protein
MSGPANERHEASARRELACTSEAASEPRPSARSERLILVEDGANGLEEHASPDGGEQTIFLAQCGGERPLDFARRAIRRILALNKQERIIHPILLVSPRFDAEAMEARMSLARILMASGTSDLILSAGADLDPALRAKVQDLADTLTEHQGGGPLSITVRFGVTAACV